MIFENLIYVIDFLNRHLGLIDEYKSNPFLVKANIFGNELLVGFDAVTYTYLKYYISYRNIRHTIEVHGKEERDMLEEKCNSLIKNIIDYSKYDLFSTIENYENIGDPSPDCFLV